VSKSSNLRREEILKTISNSERVSVKELAKTFKVTQETIRTDLKVLEDRGAINKSHGYATAKNTYHELSIDVKVQYNTNLKQSISYKALELIEDNYFVYLTPGSTTYHLARLLRGRKNITVVTNSLSIANILQDSLVELIVIGGRYSRKGKALCGLVSQQMIEALHFDIAFMGTDGFKNMIGPSTFAEEEAQINKHVIKQSSQCVLLCDSTKFNNTAPYSYGTFNDFDYIITNSISKSEQSSIDFSGKLIMTKEK